MSLTSTSSLLSHIIWKKNCEFLHFITILLFETNFLYNVLCLLYTIINKWTFFKISFTKIKHCEFYIKIKRKIKKNTSCLRQVLHVKCFFACIFRCVSSLFIGWYFNEIEMQNFPTWAWNELISLLQIVFFILSRMPKCYRLKQR